MSFGDIAFRFDAGIVLGFVNRSTRRARLNPPIKRKVGGGSLLLALPPHSQSAALPQGRDAEPPYAHTTRRLCTSESA